ncbi:hypothetical protein DENSPDRAFT_626265 [Dentipellis sp. KUC8613]|nr:hypothetical protein DENSPDRAFT_626265 [Dentipellis sp. KUC8613]
MLMHVSVQQWLGCWMARSRDMVRGLIGASHWFLHSLHDTDILLPPSSSAAPRHINLVAPSLHRLAPHPALFVPHGAVCVPRRVRAASRCLRAAPRRLAPHRAANAIFLSCAPPTPSGSPSSPSPALSCAMAAFSSSLSRTPSPAPCSQPHLAPTGLPRPRAAPPPPLYTHMQPFRTRTPPFHVCVPAPCSSAPPGLPSPAPPPDLVRAQRTRVSPRPPRTPFPSTGGMHAHTRVLTKCHRHGDNGPTVTTGLGM